MDGVGPPDLGRPKAHAVAETLRQGGGCAVLAFADSILSLSALVVAKRADVLFCCVDSPPARLATACLAALYLKPLVDIGTGIFNERTGQAAPARRMGADVRLVLPGRCLLCLGGIADLARARTELLTGPVPAARPPGWQQDRAGSLRSLNGIAVYLALRLLEDLASGHLTASTWLHLEVSAAGIPMLEHRELPPNPVCRLCALTARGDAAVGELRSVLGAM
jgi:hypothetical protein